VAASRLEVDELRCHLNDLEDRHEALACAALDKVRVARLEGHLLPNRLQSLPRQIRGAVVLAFARGPPARLPWCGFGPAGIWAG
jgi:hypothetical protein